LLVAVLQAYVFAILTCIYLNDALHPGHYIHPGINREKLSSWTQSLRNTSVPASRIGISGAGVGVGTIFGRGGGPQSFRGRRPVPATDLRLRGDRGARHLLAVDRPAAALCGVSGGSGRRRPDGGSA
jgi:hypothetical protein